MIAVTTQRAEVLCGLATLVAVSAGLAVALYAPIYPLTINGVPGGRTSLINPLADPRELPSFILVPAAISVALGGPRRPGATLYGSRDAWSAWRFLLWLATAGLLLEMLIGSLSPFRAFLLPALALALVASVLAMRSNRLATPTA